MFGVCELVIFMLCVCVFTGINSHSYLCVCVCVCVCVCRVALSILHVGLVVTRSRKGHPSQRFFSFDRQAHELGKLMISRNEREHQGTMICIFNFISRL